MNQWSVASFVQEDGKRSLFDWQSQKDKSFVLN